MTLHIPFWILYVFGGVMVAISVSVLLIFAYVGFMFLSSLRGGLWK